MATLLEDDSIAADRTDGLDYQHLIITGGTAAVSGDVGAMDEGSIAAEHSGGLDYQIVVIVP